MSLTKEDLKAIREIVREEVAKAGKVSKGIILDNLLKAQERKMEPVLKNYDDDFRPPLHSGE